MANSKELAELISLVRKATRPKAWEGHSLKSAKGKALAEEYRSLGPRTLYRHEGPEAALTKVGELSSDAEVGGMMQADEPSGKYFGSRLQDVAPLVEPNRFTPKSSGSPLSFTNARDSVEQLVDRGDIPGEEFIRARLKPNARILDAGTPERWQEVVDEFKGVYPERTKQAFQEQFTLWLRKNYDAVTFPDIAGEQPELTQTVLLNPGKAIGRKGNRYRLLSLGAALAGGAAAQPDEAQASTRTELLKKIFKEGVKSVSKKDLVKLFRESRNKLYRADIRAETLARKGFDSSIASRSLPEGDVPGIYYTRRLRDIGELVDMEDELPNVVGLPRPGSKILKGGTHYNYQALSDKQAKALEDADFASGRAIEGFIEVVQLKPGNVLARIDTARGRVYRILGLTGAATATLSTSNSEASPIYDVLKAGTKQARRAAKGFESRTSKLLAGTDFMGGKIKEVLAHPTDDEIRHIVMSDDSVYPVTKDVASSLVRNVGTRAKITELAGKETEGQLEQALKSLAYHESRVPISQSNATTRQLYRDFLAQLDEAKIGKQATPYVLVKRSEREFTMPQAYAELLQAEGHLTIVGLPKQLKRPTKGTRSQKLWPWGRK
jgi:hypothetical protein